MQEKNVAVVVLNGPHMPVLWRWHKTSRGWRPTDRFWDGRIMAAITLAQRLDAPIFICGDANGGRDLDRMCGMARLANLKVICCDNGTMDNTQGDCEAAARALENAPDVDTVHLVTCWYHMPRAMVTLRIALARFVQRNMVIERAPVWRRVVYGLLHLLAERRGGMAMLLGRPVGRRLEIGKPDRRKSRNAA